MISVKRGKLLETDAGALASTVNCKGLMGNGIALQFKRDVKGRVSSVDGFTVRKNVILTGLSTPGDCILSIVGLMGGDARRIHYRPFRRESDFRLTSVDSYLAKWLASGEQPR